MAARGVYRRAVRLDVRRWLGAHLAPAPGLPEGVEIFEVGSRHPVAEWYAEVECSAEQEERWGAAGTAFVDEVSRAVERLMRAHGFRSVQVDLHGGRLSWTPRRRGVRAARSTAAQHAFSRAVAEAEAAYGPVRDEIVSLGERARARRAEEDRRRWAAAERRKAGFDAVAERVRWSWEVGAAIRVRRDDGGRTTRELVAATGYERDVHWDSATVAEVEAAAGVGFDVWWAYVAGAPWRTRVTPDGAVSRFVRPRPPSAVTRHATTHHSSYGVGHF